MDSARITAVYGAGATINNQVVEGAKAQVVVSAMTRITAISTVAGSPGQVGPQGDEIELRKGATYIQWRVVGDPTWIDLIAIADITGPAGSGAVNSVNGLVGAVVLDTDDISDAGTTAKYVTAADLVKLAALSGTNTGDQNLTPYFHKTNDTSDAITQGTTKLLMTAAERTKLSNTSGTNTGDQTTITGNAGSATVLQTARTINGVSFNGSANITVADATKEPIITAGLTTQYFRGDKSWQTLNADVVPDGTTNKAYTATEKTKLAGVATGATANSSDATLLNRANHTGTQSADTLTDGTTNKAFLATERTKLSGIATGATANDTDANLKSRANHTGTQLASTISDFSTAADARITAANKKTDSMTSMRLLGRGTASTGPIEEITLGTGLSMSGTTLNAVGGGGGGGDVSSSVSTSVDNALVRMDGTSGKIIQSSAITVDDSGAVILPALTSPAYSAGKLFYDNDSKSLSFMNDDSNVTANLGQELWIKVRNTTGSSIPNGSAVYLSGMDSGLPTIGLAKADAAATAICCGLTTETIANNSNGYVTAIGIVHNIDTLTVGLSGGQTLFLSATTAGALTTTAPAAPNFRMRVGIVTQGMLLTGAVHVTPSTAILGLGAANQIQGVNAAGTANEMKTLNGTTNDITVTHAANSITLATGSNIYKSGGTDVPITDGGTGASDAATARTNLGLGSVAVLNSISLTANVSGILPIANGGTGRNTATTAYGLIAAGTTATGVQQTVSPGTSGQILKSNGASALPTFQTGAKADVGLGNVDNTSDATKNSAVANLTNKTFDSTSPTAFMFPGFVMAYAPRTAPSGWLLADGSAVSRTTYAGLFAALVANLGAATITIASPGVVTDTGHGLRTGDKIYFTTTGALPTGLSANTIYYVNVIDANTFRLSTTQNNSYSGVWINTSGSQSGTHTLFYAPYGLGDGSTTFNVPDLRGNVIAGKDDMGGTAANKLTGYNTEGIRGYNLGNQGGEQAHGLITAELPAHAHTAGSYDGLQIMNSSVAAGANYIGVTVGAAGASTRIATNNTGSNTPHNNIQPTAILNYIIKT